jgi:hypothetical protein
MWIWDWLCFGINGVFQHHEMGLVTLVTGGLIGHVSMNGDIQQTCSFFLQGYNALTVQWGFGQQQ